MNDRNSLGYFNIVKYLAFSMPKTSYIAIYIALCCVIFKDYFSKLQLIIISCGCVLLCGYSIFRDAAKALRNKRFLHPDIYLSVAIIGTLACGIYYDAMISTAVISMCRSFIATLYEWMEHKYHTKIENMQFYKDEKSTVERKLGNAGTLYSVISLFIIIALSVIVPLFWRLQLISWARRAFILLAAACPSALVSVASVEYYKCLNSAREQGIFFKSKNAVDNASKVTSFVFGKIELTPGSEYCIEAVEPVNISDNALMTLAAYTCSFANDEKFAAVNNSSYIEVDVSNVDMYKVLPGFGTAVSINGVSIFAGSAELMEKCGIKMCEADFNDMYIHVAAGNRYAGKIRLKKACQSSHADAVDVLKNNDIDRIIMLTSDLKATADSIGAKLNINEVWPELGLDEQYSKFCNLQDMQLENEAMAYIADSLTETELLKKADVGIAVGIITDDSADIYIPDGNHTKAAKALVLSRAFMSNFKNDLTYGCIFKLIAVILAISGFSGIWCMAVFDAIIAALALCDRNKCKYNLEHSTIKK